MRRWMWFNGLSLVMFGAFLLFVIIQSVAGWQVRNEELIQYGQAADSYWHYLNSGHLAAAVFENWESEFLQMGSYVLLTAYLVQRGSPESKPLDGRDRPDDDPDHATADSPLASRAHGITQLVYRNSLALALLGLFALSLLGHLLAGTADYNEQQAVQNGAPAITALEFLMTPRFWFQSMQNWQSEFLAVGALLVLSVVLRQHGSPQSKPVTAAHAQTGE
jgi:hypothetical protein